MSGVTLYIRPAPPQWQLPTLSVPDAQLQAYLHLAGLQHTTEELHDPTESSTGCLPALEHNSELIEADASCSSDFDVARFLLRHLCDNVVNLDDQLAPEALPNVLTFTSLIEMHLEPATLFTTWCEDRSYNKFVQKAYGSALPFPLNLWCPWRQRRLVQARFANVPAAKVYGAAGKAYASLASHLEKLYPGNAAPVSFFMGPKASTVDAVLYPHLLYQLRSPVAAPELREQISRYPVLERYVNFIMHSTAAEPARALPHRRAGWQRNAESTENRPPTEEEKKQSLAAKWWVGSVVAVVCGYAALFAQGVGAWEVEGEEVDAEV